MRLRQVHKRPMKTDESTMDPIMLKTITVNDKNGNLLVYFTNLEIHSEAYLWIYCYNHKTVDFRIDYVPQSIN